MDSVDVAVDVAWMLHGLGGILCGCCMDSVDVAWIQLMLHGCCMDWVDVAWIQWVLHGLAGWWLKCTTKPSADQKVLQWLSNCLLPILSSEKDTPDCNYVVPMVGSTSGHPNLA